MIEAINKIGSVFYGPILATFIAAISLKKVNSIGANIGLLSGVGVNVYLWLFVPDVFWFWWNAVGAVVTILTAIIASMLFSSKKEEDQHTLERTWDIDIAKSILLVAFFHTDSSVERECG